MADYDPDIVTVVDEDGKEHQFEILDRIETDDGGHDGPDRHAGRCACVPYGYDRV